MKCKCKCIRCWMWIKEKSNAGFRFWCREFKSIFPSSHLSCAHIQANELTKGYIGKKFMKFWVVLLVCGNMWPNRQKDSRHGDSRRVEFKENLQCCNFYPPKIISTERKDKCFFDNFPWSTKVLHPSKYGVLNSILNHQVLLIISTVRCSIPPPTRRSNPIPIHPIHL